MTRVQHPFYLIIVRGSNNHFANTVMSFFRNTNIIFLFRNERYLSTRRCHKFKTNMDYVHYVLLQFGRISTF